MIIEGNFFIMKKGFTIVEVSILLVIFLIVAFLVAPLSLDDTRQAKNTSRWRIVQDEFKNISYTISTQLKETPNATYNQVFEETLTADVKNSIEPYKILYMNGTLPAESYRFQEFMTTQSGAVVAYKLFKNNKNPIKGIIMYDVNGKNSPNVWGKDVFGLNIYKDRFEPFGKTENKEIQKQDCSKNGTGLYCSNYYLIGGNFE